MQTRFQNNGVSFSLLVTARGLRETPDGPSGAVGQVWANAQQKHKYTVGLTEDEGPSARELARRNRPKKGDIQIKPVDPRQFLETARP